MAAVQAGYVQLVQLAVAKRQGRKVGDSQKTAKKALITILVRQFICVHTCS